MPQFIKGSELPRPMQEEAKRLWVHRFTGEHVPTWARKPMPNGNPYPLQFKDDSDWLANTAFPVTKSGRFSEQEKYCNSAPTWPNNPELRKEARA